MSMDRFKGPVAADDYYECYGCSRRMHYELLDDDGFCEGCRPEKEKEQEDEMTEKELRELDAWIAEHVMGLAQEYAVMKCGRFYRPKSCGYTDSIAEAGRYSKADALREIVRGEPMKIIPFPTPRYTTNPAAAMMVLEKCAQKYTNLEIEFIDGTWTVGRWRGSNTTEATAETLPLAICLFARELYSK